MLISTKSKNEGTREEIKGLEILLLHNLNIKFLIKYRILLCYKVSFLKKRLEFSC